MSQFIIYILFIVIL